ncbi:RNA polymerase sigma factor [Tenacibaculum sp. SG-28]|uniref:RNA polymerase sigma factor n=1 Tax=Tenacibaculum sp. SG-28 TaxID=754426 RepID=UPI000D472398|nr:RNA polymerase sigma factor [Tenacibaculum sp. SG-28]PQJ19701.1 hypothetical protein BSU00_12090 [Tenacibaculum sp. SG-28]
MKKNKRALFERIYSENYAMVMQMCLGYVKGNRAMAKDLSQEVFLKVWNNLDKFRGDASPKTWIYRITINTCIQQVKKEQKRELKLTEGMPLQSQSYESDVAEELEENISELYNAIGSLKEIDRLIIIMVLENETYESIAKIIGISSTNVRVKIHRIKKRLEKILKNSNDGK